MKIFAAISVDVPQKWALLTRHLRQTVTFALVAMAIATPCLVKADTYYSGNDHLLYRSSPFQQWKFTKVVDNQQHSISTKAFNIAQYGSKLYYTDLNQYINCFDITNLNPPIVLKNAPKAYDNDVSTTVTLSYIYYRGTDNNLHKIAPDGTSAPGWTTANIPCYGAPIVYGNYIYFQGSSNQFSITDLNGNYQTGPSSGNKIKEFPCLLPFYNSQSKKMVQCLVYQDPSGYIWSWQAPAYSSLANSPQPVKFASLPVVSGNNTNMIATSRASYSTSSSGVYSKGSSSIAVASVTGFLKESAPSGGFPGVWTILPGDHMTLDLGLPTEETLAVTSVSATTLKFGSSMLYPHGSTGSTFKVSGTLFEGRVFYETDVLHNSQGTMLEAIVNPLTGSSRYNVIDASNYNVGPVQTNGGTVWYNHTNSSNGGYAHYVYMAVPYLNSPTTYYWYLYNTTNQSNAGFSADDLSGQVSSYKKYPRYQIYRLIYAVPGSANGSNTIQYTNGATNSTSTSVTNSFDQNYGVSISGTFSSGLVSGSASASFNTDIFNSKTQTESDSTSLSSSVAVTTPSTDGINHDGDTFVLILNPVTYQVIAPLENYLAQYTTTTTTPNYPSVIYKYVTVGDLKNPRSANYRTLQSYGFSQSDFRTILSIDPFSNAPGVIPAVSKDSSGNSQVSNGIDTNRYQLLGSPISYAPSNNGFLTFGGHYQVDNSKISSSDNSLSYNVSFSFTATYGDTNSDSVSLTNTDSFTWAQDCQNTTETDKTYQIDWSVQSPSSAYGNGNSNIFVYMDRIYNTLMFSYQPVSVTQLAGLNLGISSVKGGTSITSAVVYITKPAPTGGFVVSLTSANTGAATVPATVTIPSGQSSVGFTVSTPKVSSSTSSLITARNGSISKSTTLTVTN